MEESPTLIEDSSESKIAFAEDDLVDNWKAIGVTKGFSNDSEIAKFLISLYCVKAEAGASVAQQCAQCQTPLALYCSTCQLLYSTPPPSTSPGLPTPVPIHTPHTQPLEHAGGSFSSSATTPLPPPVLYLHSLTASQTASDADKNYVSTAALASLSVFRSQERRGSTDDNVNNNNSLSSKSTGDGLEREFSETEEGHSCGEEEDASVEKSQAELDSPGKKRKKSASKKKPTRGKGAGKQTPAKKKSARPSRTNKSGYKPQKTRGVKKKTETGNNNTAKSSTTGRKIKTKSHICSLCQKPHYTLNQLTLHVKRNHGPFVCAKCGKSYETFISYDFHVRRTCKPDDRFECDLCTSVYLTEMNLNSHKRRMHSDNAALKCSVCGQACPTMRHYRNHVKKHKKGQHSSTCEYCGVQIMNACAMKSHILAHRGEKPFACTKCDKTFHSHSSRYTHMRAHHSGIEKPYRCDQCDKGFTKPDNLKYHIFGHTGEKPYKCKLCPSAFVRGDYLSKHMRTHTGDKPYRCDLCQAAFSHVSNLKAHEVKCRGGGVASVQIREVFQSVEDDLEQQSQRFMILQPGLFLPKIE